MDLYFKYFISNESCIPLNLPNKKLEWTWIEMGRFRGLFFIQPAHQSSGLGQTRESDIYLKKEIIYQNMSKYIIKCNKSKYM